MGIILLGAALGFFLLFRFQGDDMAGSAQMALGAWLTVLGAVDLIWLATGDVDRVFLKTRKGSRAAALAYLLAGLTLLGIGIAAVRG